MRRLRQRCAATWNRDSAAMLEFVKELVDIESYATQTGGTNAVGDRMCQRLESARLHDRARAWRAARRRSSSGSRNSCSPATTAAQLGFQRVARIKGNGRGRVLVLGDLDTAFLPGKGFPFRLEGDRAFGPGIADMKGGLAVAVFALEGVAGDGPQQPRRDHLRVQLRRARRQPRCAQADRAGGARTPIGSSAWNAPAKAATSWARARRSAWRSSKCSAAMRMRAAPMPKGISAIEAMARKITAIHALTDPAREIFLCVGPDQRRLAAQRDRRLLHGHHRHPHAGSPKHGTKSRRHCARSRTKVELPGSSAEVSDRLAPARRAVDRQDRPDDRDRARGRRRAGRALRRAALARPRAAPPSSDRSACRASTAWDRSAATS